MRSLRRLCRFVFLITALLLTILVWTGSQQIIQQDNYKSSVEESERIIFLYATIREQTTEGLLSRNSSSLLASATEFEKLNSRYGSMLDNHLIQSQYKLSFLKDFDLERVVVGLRYVAERPNDEDAILIILDQLRQINKQYLQFDRIVVSDMKNQVMQSQKRALILMGIIIALICFTLLVLYQKSVKPLLHLAAQIEQVSSGDTSVIFTAEKNCSVETRTVISAFNQLSYSSKRKSAVDPSDGRRETEFAAIVNEVTNGLNGIINYSQLLTDYCETEEIGDEQKQILSKIIETGEKSAAILQKGLQRSDT